MKRILLIVQYHNNTFCIHFKLLQPGFFFRILQQRSPNWLKCNYILIWRGISGPCLLSRSLGHIFMDIKGSQKSARTLHFMDIQLNTFNPYFAKIKWYLNSFFRIVHAARCGNELVERSKCFFCELLRQNDNYYAKKQISKQSFVDCNHMKWCEKIFCVQSN